MATKIGNILARYRQEAQDLAFKEYRYPTTYRAAILQSIFRPKYPSVPNKGPMDMLHPDIDKLHLPHGVYIADWRKYRVEDHPALVKFQNRCHNAGLHDHWLKNDCHKFYENTGGGDKSKIAAVTHQMSWGFCAAVILYGIKQVYTHFFPFHYEHTKEYIEKYGPGGKPHH